VVEELCYAIKGDPLQIRREGDDVNVISSGRVSGCPGVATEYNVLKNIGDIEVCTNFKML
jgi:hypothetical protein